MVLFNCAICQEKHKCVLEILGCGHHFCSSCLYQWYAKKHTCALCRGFFNIRGVRVKSVEGVKTRSLKKLVDEENLLLELTLLTHILKSYHICGKTTSCELMMNNILTKCLDNIDIFKNSNNPQIKTAIDYMKKYGIYYRVYIYQYKNKYDRFLREVGVLNENVVISNQSVVSI